MNGQVPSRLRQIAMFGFGVQVQTLVIGAFLQSVVQMLFLG
jgi:hypothetical protein